MSQQINLFDARFRKQKQHLTARTLVLTAAVLLVAALALQELYAYQNRSLAATLAQADQRATELRDQTVRFAKEFTAQGRSTALTDEIARVEEQLRLRRALFTTMQSGVGGNVGGFSPYLTALSRHTMNGVWLTGVDIGGQSGELVLKGRVLDSTLVPAYIRQLRQAPPFAGSTVNELRVAAKADADKKTRQVEFSLSIPLAPKGAS
jgi:hypothetical protein